MSRRDTRLQTRWIGSSPKLNFEESASLVNIGAQDKPSTDQQLTESNEEEFEAYFDRRINQALNTGVARKYPLVQLTLELLRGSDVTDLLNKMYVPDVVPEERVPEPITKIQLKPQPPAIQDAPTIVVDSGPKVETFIPYFVSPAYITNDNKSTLSGKTLIVTATLMKPPPSGSIMLFPFGQDKRKLPNVPVDLTFDYDGIKGVFQSVTADESIVVHQLTLDGAPSNMDEIVFPVTCQCTIEL